MYRDALSEVQDKTWNVLVQKSRGAGYDRIILSESKDASQAFAVLAEGEWSGKVVQEFDTARGAERGAFRCKLMELSADARYFRLYVTGIGALSGWSYPEDVAGQIPSPEGLPLPTGGHFGLGAGWIDPQTFIEVYNWGQIWFAEAGRYLLANEQWDLFFLVVHDPDTFYHMLINEMEPLAGKPSRAAESFVERIEIPFYQNLDRMIGQIIELADQETVIAIVSDHGTKYTARAFVPARLLAEAGLTVFETSLEDEIASWTDRLWPFVSPPVDWAQTKAVVQGECYVWVNLKGRDPGGIVEPGAEYERTRDQIIQALEGYVDPETGKRPVAFAMRREQARMFGLHGDRVGDVVYALDPNYGENHGSFWPTEEIGVGSLKGMFVLSGPGVRKNVVLQRTVFLTDLVPTLCYLADLPVPRQAEGAIVYQALEDPDAKLRHQRRLQDNYDRLKGIYNRQRSMSHSYNE
jgi:hypothetical protein